MSFHYQNPFCVYSGKRFEILSVEAPHPKGGIVKRELISHPGAVVILPFLDRDTLILIKNERYVVQKTLWELPAGTLEKDESKEQCALRELEEETGYRAAKMIPLFHFFPSPGICNEILYVFFGEELTFQAQNLDETETIVSEAISFSNAIIMIREGQIVDAKTICSLLYYQVFCRSKSI
jgi:ADP-ribose pyrophosphatase